MLSHKVVAGLGGYPFRSITEDYEIAYECICKGYNQFYYEHAIIYSEEAITHKEYNKRRMRWIKGFSQFTSKYNKKVKALAKKDPEVKRRTHLNAERKVPSAVATAQAAEIGRSKSAKTPPPPKM